MTFDEFKKDFLAFLNDSTVNLGRKGTKTRQAFIETATARLDAFDLYINGESIVDSHANPKEVFKIAKEKSKPNPMSRSVICIKPGDKDKVLNIGKGVHAMTPSESMRADEQLNRSPFGVKPGKRGLDNE